ncbi:MAG: hypothetical protein DMG72_20555 [Acidobacteria bacterium]|nr:MAG: hypothetical protein DMG72_20555 [Acidobacteriota bacterium]
MCCESYRVRADRRYDGERVAARESPRVTARGGGLRARRSLSAFAHRTGWLEPADPLVQSGRPQRSLAGDSHARRNSHCANRLVTASCGGRGASVIAPCHIVFATVAQLVPDLQTALRSAFKEGRLAHNSFACVISGSSRTADIEKILVQGAHGPRRLVIILQTGR